MSARRAGIPFVIAAPSGTGKTTVCRRLVAADPQLELSVSHTTRTVRPGERDGEHYHFVSPAQFQALLQQLQTLALRDGAALERRINETGYAMLETRGSGAAIKVFELNTRLFPQSSNARDSLAQAQAAAKSP